MGLDVLMPSERKKAKENKVRTKEIILMKANLEKNRIQQQKKLDKR